MIRAYKTRIYPNNIQATQLSKCAGISRFAFNWGLNEWKKQYEAGEKPSGINLCKKFNSIKSLEFPFVREVPYAITESAFRNLDNAFKNFFRRLKQGGKLGYPKFKSRFRKKSFQLRGVKIFEKSAYFPRIGNIKLSEENYIPIDGDFGIYSTISKNGMGWFLSVFIDDGLNKPAFRDGITLGVDVGIKSMAVFSDGIVFENPKADYKAHKNIAKLQRELHRRQKGGKNRKKTQDKLSRAYARIGNIRSHVHHSISNHAVHSGIGKIVIEDLNVSGMLQNRYLARAVADAGMNEIHRQIIYKAEWNGVEVIKADRWFASSKTCSGCGEYLEITLADRYIICPACGLEIDRDLNAAINLIALDERQNMPGLSVELA